MERSGPENLRFRYALGFRGGRPLLALATQLIELGSEQLSGMIGSARGSHLRLVGPGGETPDPRRQVPFSLLPQSGLRFLVCGSALSCGLPGVAFDDAEDPSAMWKATLEALHRIREQEGLCGAADISLIKDVRPENSPAGEALDAAGYMAIANEPNMVLRLDPSWRTHEDYLSSLTSRYRRSCRKVLRRVNESGFRVEPLDDVRGNAGTLHRLYLHVQAQAMLRPLALPAEFLPTLAESLGDRFRCLVIRDGGGRIVAFVTMIRDAKTAVGYFLGYDPEINRTVPLYLRLLHAVVEEALRTGCRRVSFGRTALEPKARLGAEPVSLNVWVQHRQRSLHASISSWLRTALFESVPTRRPFSTT